VSAAPASGYDLTRWLVGQGAACRRLELLLAADHLPSLILAGLDGTGKRTLALRLAQAANCTAAECRPCGECHQCRMIAAMNHPDIKLLVPIRLPKGRNSEPADVGGLMMERFPDYRLGVTQPDQDPGHQIPIDAVRWIRSEMAKPPVSARRRFVIVLHAHRMNDRSANAFLKTLEEPQSQTTLVLVTSSPASLLATVRSRCRLIRLAEVAEPELVEWLGGRAKAAASDISTAAAVGAGSPGRALRYLENPESCLDPSVLSFFAADAPPDEAATIELARQLEKTPSSLVAGTLLFLFREALRTKLGVPTAYAATNPAVARRAAAADANYLRRAVRHLLDRLGDSRLATNQLLANYTLLVALRPAGSGR
jgi:DNA polymerase-3 subunit delta'